MMGKNVMSINADKCEGGVEISIVWNDDECSDIELVCAFAAFLQDIKRRERLCDMMQYALELCNVVDDDDTIVEEGYVS